MGLSWIVLLGLACGDLTKLELDHVAIVASSTVGAGELSIPGGGRDRSPELFSAFERLPAFCRVQAIARPAAGSKVGIEVWLPAGSAWNGRYLGAGNGGYGGSFGYSRLGEAVNAGYAASSTDTGHRGASEDTSWAEGHREKQIDFDYRAVHETARTAKALIEAFYGKPPLQSYFNACSTGGRQGLMEAERYPADYDGFLLGAPALEEGFTTHVHGKLDAFAHRGGKIILYHGGEDGPGRSVAFFDDVARRLGRSRADPFLQLYVVPGMGHCGSGDGPDDIGQWLRPDADPQHSLFKALERWVEDERPPTGVIATRFVRDGDAASGVAATRVLCPYPAIPGSCSP